MQRVSTSRVLALAVALGSVACGSYDESSGLIAVGGTQRVATVRLNEVMPRNSDTVADENGEFDDWVELYNSGDTDVSLAGYFISDKEDSLYKWQLPSEVVIAAGSVLVLWADKDAESGARHLGFGLSGDGEGVWLTSPDGDRVDSVSFGPAPPGSSYSRYPDGADIGEGGSWQWCASPTPDELNGDSCDG